MSEVDRLVERLASRFRVPPDPLAGVAARREQRARDRRVAAGVGIFVSIALLAALSQVSGPRGAAPSQTGAPGSIIAAAKGLQVSIPSEYSILYSAGAFATLQEQGGWGVLGSPSCGWAQPGSVAIPTAAYVDQFVMAAFLGDIAAPSEPTRLLLVLRSDQSLVELTSCEISLREKEGGELLEQGTVTVGRVQATRLVFVPIPGGGYLPAPSSRDVLFLVDSGSSRWVLSFTAFGDDAGQGAVSEFDALAATVRLSG